MKAINKKYRALFKRFNEEYFDGKLPRYRIQVVNSISSKLHPLGHCNRRRRLIRIREAEEGSMIETLIHEMAHAATNDNHGPIWKEEMNRLHTVGAPIDLRDLDRQQNHLTKSLIEDLVLEGSDDVTVQAIAQHVVYWYGFADSGAELLRKYPWIRKAFREARSERRRLKKLRDEFRRKMGQQ